MAALIHLLGYITNYFYFFGWLMWIPAIVLTVAAVLRILKDGYIKSPYVPRKKIFYSASFVIAIVTMCYVIFNVIFNYLALEHGGGEYKDGVYYLINLGERVKEISEDEYTKLLLAEYRLFTGHILFLYSLTVLYFKMKVLEHEPV